MATLITITPSKTYATLENVDRAVEKKYAGIDELRYIVVQHTDGRFYPLFIGMRAVEFGVHFNFNVVN